MKVKLTNFRSFENKEVDFGEDGTVLISGDSGTGKCLGEGTLVFTHRGCRVPVETVRAGDLLLGDDYTSRCVLRTTSGMGMMYEVKHANGDSYVVNGYHILVLLDTLSFEIVEISVLEYLALGEGYRNKLVGVQLGIDIEYASEVSEETLRATIRYIHTNTLQCPKAYFSSILKMNAYSRLRILNGVTTRVVERIMYSGPYGEYIKDLMASLCIRTIDGGGLVVGVCSIHERGDLPYRGQYIENNITVSLIGEGIYYGFELDGNKRFILGNYVVTHNSTILDGIYFCLYGVGTKLSTHGKKGCIVKITAKGMVIKRSKNPTSLSVKVSGDKEYLDLDGQDIINSRFGVFNDILYIQQNSSNSFVYMGPTEKLSFLENIAFKDLDIHSLKAKCKDMKKGYNDAFIKVKAEYELLEKLHSGDLVPEAVEWPYESLDNKKKVMMNDKKRLSELTSKSQQCKELVKELHVTLRKYISRSSVVSELEERLVASRGERGSVQEDLDSLDDIQSTPEELQAVLDSRAILCELRAEEKRLTDYVDEETAKVEKIEDLREKLWAEECRDDVEYTLQCFEEFYRYVDDIANNTASVEETVEALREYDDSVETMEEELDGLTNAIAKRTHISKLQEEALKCPSCGDSLRYVDSALVAIGEELPDTSELEDIGTMKKRAVKLKSNIKEVSSLQQKLVILEKRKTSILKKGDNSIEVFGSDYTPKRVSALRDEHRELKKYYDKCISTEAEVLGLENSMKSTKKAEVKLKKTLKAIEEHIETPSELSGTEIRKEICRIAKLIASKRSLKAKLEAIDTSIERDEKRLREVATEGLEEELKVAREDLELNESYIEEATEEISRVSERLQKVEEYKVYIKERKAYKERKAALESKKKALEEAEDSLVGSSLLLEKIVQSESVYMNRSIDVINAHVMPYIERFFGYSMSVSLSMYKDTAKKGKKPSVNLSIEHKGYETDLKSLSAGEKQRVSLAFILAFSEMYSPKMLMLDECVNNLDEENTGIVMEAIDELYPGKFVLMAAHKVVKGAYDRVVILD
jgi:DNA repair exonuclease SbcCD ATPase subunit